MEKKQKEVIMQGFRLLRLAAAEGERSTHEGDPDAILEVVDNMLHLLGRMKDGLGHHIGAQAVLKGIEVKRPKVAAKIGRPKLTLVKR